MELTLFCDDTVSSIFFGIMFCHEKFSYCCILDNIHADADTAATGWYWPIMLATRYIKACGEVKCHIWIFFLYTYLGGRSVCHQMIKEKIVSMFCYHTWMLVFFCFCRQQLQGFCSYQFINQYYLCRVTFKREKDGSLLINKATICSVVIYTLLHVLQTMQVLWTEV